MQVPLDNVDLSLVSVLYTEGNMAAIVPIYDYNFQVTNTPITHLAACGTPPAQPSCPALVSGCLRR